MTEQEKQRLAELASKKKQARLSDEEFAEFKTLLKKSGKGGKSKIGSSKSAAAIGSYGNDFSWWNKENELIRDSSNILPDWIPGEPLDPENLPTRLRGVIRVNIRPQLGSSWFQTDPVNLEFRDLFLKMFAKYRGITAYQYPDLAFAILGSVEVAKLVAKLERIYGILNRYDKKNFNVPRTEYVALGLTATQAQYIWNHLSDYRYDLNILIKKAQRVYIPKQMSAVADAISLLAYEYLDHDSVKGQRILFDCDTFGTVDEQSLTTGTSIVLQRYSTPALINTTNPDANMFPVLERMIEALVGSDSMQKIFGDIGVWFGEEQALEMLTLPEDYVIQPVYSEEILHKFHNIQMVSQNLATVISHELTDEDKTTLNEDLDNFLYRWYQVNNTIKSRLCVFNDEAEYVYGNQSFHGETIGVVYSEQIPFGAIKNGIAILDTYRKDMTPETVCEGMLFKVGYINRHVTDLGYSSIIYTSAFWACDSITFYGLNQAGTGVEAKSLYANNQFGISTMWAECAARMSVVDWAPLSFSCVIEDGDYYYSPLDVFGDYDNIKVVAMNDMRRIHSAVTMSGIKTELVVKQSSK